VIEKPYLSKTDEEAGAAFDRPLMNQRLCSVLSGKLGREIVRAVQSAQEVYWDFKGPMSSSNNTIQLPEPPEEEPRQEEAVVISQTTFFYFLIAVVFFAAGFIVAWVTYSTTAGAAAARDLKSAAADGAREAVQTEMPGMQATTVALARSAAVVDAAPQPTALPPAPVTIDVGSSPSWGSENAKVTIVEYSDFQCSFCERFFQLTYPQLKKQYGDKIRFVYKNFAFLTQDSEPAAIAAICAHEQGKFWEFHDALFNDQQNRGRDTYIKFATDVGVPNIAQFTQCIDSNKYAATVQADTAEGQNFGVTGTPTFFINGVALVGAQPLDVFRASIDRILAEAGN
jgi:protein-disulfide isomerase